MNIEIEGCPAPNCVLGYVFEYGEPCYPCAECNGTGIREAIEDPTWLQGQVLVF